MCLQSALVENSALKKALIAFAVVALVLVVSKKATHDDAFGKSPEGGFVDLVSRSVCEQTK